MITADEMERYMRLALEEARLAFDAGEVPVGAVLVCGGEVVARAHNRVEADKDATAHAELLCMREGMAKRGPRLGDCTLYVTLEPCAMCAGACINACRSFPPCHTARHHLDRPTDAFRLSHFRFRCSRRLHLHNRRQATC